MGVMMSEFLRDVGFTPEKIKESEAKQKKENSFYENNVVVEYRNCKLMRIYFQASMRVLNTKK